MNIMVVGANGQLGTSVREVLARETTDSIIGVTRKGIEFDSNTVDFDTSDRRQWKDIVLSREFKPEVIVNAAAMTNVDRCETDREEAWRSNVQLVEILTDMCRKVDARLIHMSTDHIFDGKSGPYTEKAVPNPVNYYGRTKLAAENVCKNARMFHTIIRTLWLYGAPSTGRVSFVEWLISQLTKPGEVKIVDDEFGNPTRVDDVSTAIMKTIEAPYTGVLNVAGADVISRMQWARHIATVFDFDPDRIVPTTSTTLHRAAVRPLRSGLITLKAQAQLGVRPTDTVTALEIYRILRERKSNPDKRTLRTPTR